MATADAGANDETTRSNWCRTKNGWRADPGCSTNCSSLSNWGWACRFVLLRCLLHQHLRDGPSLSSGRGSSEHVSTSARTKKTKNGTHALVISSHQFAAVYYIEHREKMLIERGLLNTYGSVGKRNAQTKQKIYENWESNAPFMRWCCCREGEKGTWWRPTPWHRANCVPSLTFDRQRQVKSKKKKKNSLLQEDVRIASSGSWRYDCAQALKPFLIMTKAKQNKKKVQRVYIRVLGNRRSKAYLRPRAAYYTRTTEHCGVDFRSRGRFPCVGGTPCAGITSKTTKEKDLAPLLLHLSSC